MPDTLTTIDCVVAPVDQRYALAALAVSVTLSPAQNAVGPEAVIVGAAGAGFTVTVVAAEGALVHPAVVT